MDLKDKVVVITGAGRGLGRGMAVEFAKKGAKIAAVDLNPEDLAVTIAEIEAAGSTGKSYIANVAKEDEVEKLFNDIATDLGSVDGLINNAGILRDGLMVKKKDGEITKMSLQQWQMVIDVNLTGVFLCSREAAAKMLELDVEEGVIINISSVARSGNFGQTNYSAAKAGVAVMAETWGKELARYNIRTGSVAPGTINTDMIASMKQESRDRLVAGVPLKRLGEAAHIAKSCIFIFENDYMTGRCIETDGGLRV